MTELAMNWDLIIEFNKHIVNIGLKFISGIQIPQVSEIPAAIFVV